MHHAAFIRTVLLLVLSATIGLSQERVTFRTTDGLTIVGDLYEVDRAGPTVVALPMFRNVRTSWKPLADPLKRKGINLLALDLRGHGESATELAGRIRRRDAEVFNAMWKDVAGAVEFLTRRGFDPTRLGLIGASVGCSVTVDAIRRDPGPFRAACIMTPGPNYLGVDTIAHAKEWPGTPIWILCSTEERAKSEPVAKALGADGKRIRIDLVTGTRIHGTRMFGKVSGIETRIAKYFNDQLAPQADLAVPSFTKDDKRIDTAGFVRLTRRVSWTKDKATWTLMAFRVGDVVTLGAMVKGADFSGQVRFSLGETAVEVPFDTKVKPKDKVAARTVGQKDAKVTAQQASFRGTHWINAELKVNDWFTKRPMPLVVEFLPKSGEPVRLPGASASFAVTFVAK